MQQTLNQIDNWKIIKKIGDGSFGQIYEAYNCESSEQNKKCIAIKTQSINNVKQMLSVEYNIYQQFVNEPGFPAVYKYSEKQSYSYMVMEKLQITLDTYAARLFPNSFIPKDCLLSIMKQTLIIIEKIHEKGFLYRDVKPGNFMLKQPYNDIFIIDFGLSKSYLNNGVHIVQKIGKKLVGTPLFCSVYTHSGIEQSRRDDIQCWIYTMLYLSTNLPWQSVLSQKHLSKDQQYQQIGRIKKCIQWHKFIKQHQQIPQCFMQIIQLNNMLQFQEKPNYQKILSLISHQHKKICGVALQKEDGVKWKSEMYKKQQSRKKINKINFKLKCPLLQKQEKNKQVDIEKQNRGYQVDGI